MVKLNERKKLRKIIGNALYSLVPFELFYKIIGAVILIPILISILNGTVRLSGFSYVTEENIFDFLLKPQTIFILLLLIIFFALYVFIEISAIVISVNNALYGKRITLRYLVYQVLLSVKKTLFYKNLPMFLIALIFVPLVGVGFSSSAISNISILNYVYRLVDDITWLKVICNILFFVICAVAILFMFAFQYYLLNKESPLKSLRLSVSLVIKKYKKILKGFGLFFLIIILPLILIFLLIFGMLYLLILGTNNLPGYVTIIFSIMIASSVFMLFIIQTLSVISFFIFSTALFFECGENKYVPIHPEEYKKITYGRIGKIQKVVFSVTALLVIGQAILFYLRLDQGLLDNVDGSTLVTAHRGMANKAPENSLSSINYAILEYIDFVEIDVQETKDGRIVLVHDSNLKKYTRGVINKNIWDTNYDEIKDLDFGSWYGPDFKDERIATLEDAIALCDGKIRINIELKDNGHSVDLPRRVHAILEENDFINSCVITSQNITFLRQMKELSEEYEVGYLVSLGLGKYYNETDMDFYSVNYNFVTKELVTKLHKRGQKIHAWTVDDPDEIERLTELGVDNIITDKADEVKKQVIIKRTKTSFFIGKLVDLIS